MLCNRVNCKLKRIVALKMIRPERLMRAADLRRFKNETRIIAQLDHPNIIDILNVDEVDGVHFFTMRMSRTKRTCCCYRTMCCGISILRC